jgi:prepilin-type N-terminal cleavage/methylation domain-containing protein
MSAAGERGFTLMEVVTAMLLLTVGLLGVLGVYDGSRGLTAASERTTVMAHRAEAEIERIRGLGWAGIALDAVPTRSADPANPASWLTTDAPPRLRPDRRSAATVEDLVVDPGLGRVPATARTWDDGRLSGRLYAWVSRTPDAHCGAGCPDGGEARRITVAVTIEGDGPERRPLVVSVLVTDPSAAPAGLVADGSRNPLEDPTISCAGASGAVAPCVTPVASGSGTTWFLYDTPAREGSWAPVTGDHPTDRTVAPLGLCLLPDVTGCPGPDLMGDEPTPAADVLPPLLDRSTDVPGSAGTGGRVLERDDVECDGAPSADNATSQRWVTPPLQADTRPTGQGGMTLYSRTTSGSEARVTVCVQLSVAPGPVRELLGLPTTILGTASYTLAAWPAVMTPVSFAFAIPGQIATVAAGTRISARVWLAASSRSDVVLAYDHPAVQSSLQLNVR